MADMLAAAAAWLQGVAKASFSQAVTYTRGANSVVLQVTMGRKLLSIGTEYGGNELVWTDADIIFASADLVLGGVLTLPQRGDQVAIAFGQQMGIYNVLAPTGEQPWKWNDPYQFMIRAHLKLLSTTVGGSFWGGSFWGSGFFPKRYFP